MTDEPASLAALPATAYAPNPTLDDWRKAAEQREDERHAELLAQRLKCAHPGCEELGVWFTVGCVRGDGTPIPDNTAYCIGHPGGSISAGSGGFLSLNYHGWLPDGSTWQDGFPRMDDLGSALADEGETQ